MLAIIQARLSSNRLRGKVLKKINNKYLLERVFENVLKSKKVKKIIVATSSNQSDDDIVKFCLQKKINYFRGKLDNVSGRFFDLLKNCKEKSFIRICADSPFLDTNLIDRGISIFKRKKIDIVTNVYPRSYPKGQSIEIFRKDIFIDNISKIKSAYYKEHFPKYFYENSKKFKIKNFKYKKNYSSLNLSVDSEKDLKIARKIAEIIDNQKTRVSLDKIIKLFKKFC